MFRLDHLFSVSQSQLQNSFDSETNDSRRQLGIAVAQGFCYHRAFPRDNRLLKCLVSDHNSITFISPLRKFRSSSSCSLLNNIDHIHYFTISQVPGYVLYGLDKFHVLVVFHQLFSKLFSNVSAVVSCLSSCILIITSSFNAALGIQR